MNVDRLPYVQRDIPLEIESLLISNECIVCKAHCIYDKLGILLRGVVCVSNYQILFISTSKPQNHSTNSNNNLQQHNVNPLKLSRGEVKEASIEEKIPLGLIDRIEKREESLPTSSFIFTTKVHMLAVFSKDGRQIDFQFKAVEDRERIYHHILLFAFPQTRNNLFAFFYHPCKEENKVIDLYPDKEESDDESSGSFCSSASSSIQRTNSFLSVTLVDMRSNSNNIILTAGAKQHISSDDDDDDDEDDDNPSKRHSHTSSNNNNNNNNNNNSDERFENTTSPKRRRRKRHSNNYNNNNNNNNDMNNNNNNNININIGHNLKDGNGGVENNTILPTSLMDNGISNNDNHHLHNNNNNNNDITMISEGNLLRGTNLDSDYDFELSDDELDGGEDDFMQYNGWGIFTPKKEYSRLGVRVKTKQPHHHTSKKRSKHRGVYDSTGSGIAAPPSATLTQSGYYSNNKSKWRLSKVNWNYTLCPTYPRLIAVPRSIKDEELVEARCYRKLGRIPILSFIHPENLAVLCRASQISDPNRRCLEDENIIEQIRLSSSNADAKLIIFDIVVSKNPKSNNENYQNVDYEYFVAPTDISVVREALLKQQILCNECQRIIGMNTGEIPNAVLVFEALKDIKECGWLNHIQSLLIASQRIVHYVHDLATCLLVQCELGFDICPQVISLAMLIMDPFYRTIEGFEILIEKEWISGGHKFADRCGHGVNNVYSSSERSPVFFQFIECVWQLLNQQPDSFEFTEEFLLCIAENLYSCRFGTFLSNNEKERRFEDYHRRTTSLWSYTNCNPHFLNPRYKQLVREKRKVSILNVNASWNSLQVWISYHLPYLPANFRPSRKVIMDSEEILRLRINELEDKQKELMQTIEYVRIQNLELIEHNEQLSLQNLKLQELLSKRPDER